MRYLKLPDVEAHVATCPIYCWHAGAQLPSRLDYSLAILYRKSGLLLVKDTKRTFPQFLSMRQSMPIIHRPGLGLRWRAWICVGFVCGADFGVLCRIPK